MQLQEIIDNLKTKAGISRLNAMQEAMAGCHARQVELLAPTGSGKTVAFAIYALQRLKKNATGVQLLIIAPTRELVMQIQQVFRDLAGNFKVTALYGGHTMTDEVNSLTVVPAVIVATPGRLLDHLKRGQVDLTTVTTLVLDEYDKSLELGFADEMSRIVKRLPSVKSIVLTSATRLKSRPDFISLDTLETLDFTGAIAAPRHRMQVVRVESPERDKIRTLTDLLHSLDNQKTIIFVNHRESAERVYEMLVKAGLPAGLYHGALEQHERQMAIDMLANGTTPVLVATDLAARGLDIDNIGSVIHYHMPVNQETWTHRNGRTARQDADGTIYVLTAEGENQPDYIVYDRDYVPTGHSNNPIHSDKATIYFNAGRREKISRGDIVGYLINKGGLTASEIGAITLYDHSAIAAIPRDKVGATLAALSPHRLKKTRVRVTRVAK